MTATTTAVSSARRTPDQIRAPRGGIPPDARAVLRIDLAALRANWATLNQVSGTAECAGVIKAEAYGLGLEQIARALVDGGCATIFVATLDEGRRVRAVDPGITIYVLDGLMPASAAHFAGFDLRPVLGSIAEIEEWAAYCTATGRRRPAAVHIDTGMHRLGLEAADVAAIADRADLFAAFQLALVMSHLACADQRDHPMNRAQRRAFDALRAQLPAAPASLANSGGTFLGPEFHYDLVRPGIALYGGRAFEGAPNPMRTVVRLAARILQVRDVHAGDTIGYGATYHVDGRARIATVACGYADGFLRALGGPDGRPGPMGMIGDYPVPVVGRVSMDTITLDVTAVPPALAARGAWVEVMGDRITVDDLTDRAGTIGYELLTRLGRRVLRVYEDG